MEKSTLEGTKSTHKVEVLEFCFSKSEPHFNADKLRTIKIGDSEYTYCLNIEDWKDKENIKVAWVPPDSLVDITRPEFAFLAAGAKLKNELGVLDKQGKYVVVRAKNIRGVVSYGLLVPYNGILEVGQDAADDLGVVHYQPGEEPIKQNDGETDSAPSGVYYKYDIDSGQKWANKVFKEGDLVAVTRKYHGECWKGLYKDGKFHVSSHRNWKKEFAMPPEITVQGLIDKGVDPVKAQEIYDLKVTNYKPVRSKWWNGLYNTPGLKEWLVANEGKCIYGEIIATKPRFNYGLKPGDVRVLPFDVLNQDGTWMPFADFLLSCDRFALQTVEVIHHYYPYNFEKLRQLAEDLEYADCDVNEGIVFVSLQEKWTYGIGRHKFKIVSSKYSERN